MLGANGQLPGLISINKFLWQLTFCVIFPESKGTLDIQKIQ